jgi:uncharacterized protein (DUF488 family)
LELFTIGHGTLVAESFAALLRGAGITHLVDIRTAPGSRRAPHFSRAAMERWLPEAGIGYRWEPRLGGWRRPLPGSPNTALRNASFRGYADHMGSSDFRAALAELLAEATQARTAVMCSESLWWRCHRRLLADAAVLVGGASVIHIGHDGSISLHRPAVEASVSAGRLVYPTSPQLRLDQPPPG